MLNKSLTQFHAYIADLVTSDTVLQMDDYIQHGDITTLEHVIAVSYTAFVLAKRMQADIRTTVRAAMLHDLYLYDWHIKDPATRPPLTHGFTHPAKAVENAKKYFNPDEKELRIIRSHMWPLTLFHMPTSKEAFIVSMADKYCATNETLGKYDDSALRKNIKEYMIYIKKIKAQENLRQRSIED